MIIPVRCFTCGKVLAHLWEDYLQELQEKHNINEEALKRREIVGNIDDKSIEAVTMEKMGIKRYCCKRMFISHVEIFQDI